MSCENVSAEKHRRILMELPKDITSYFKYLMQFGSVGVDCSEKTLNVIHSWDLAAIRLSVASCNRCNLASVRKKAVFGKGDSKARVVFVGEMPEPEDAHTGVPYSGEAGELLTKIISAMKLSRDSVYITCAVKCGPIEKQETLKDPIRICKSYLVKEIDIIKPKIICALGDVAAKAVLGIPLPIHRIRGRFHVYNGIQVMPTYSPQHLLKHPEDKRAVWQDIQQVMTLYESDR